MKWEASELMIINTGCRTDIPAYYSHWFYNRIKAGFVCVRNPYYQNQVMEYELTPEVVDCLVFCTKNPAPMLQRIHDLDQYAQLWFVTITPYGKEIEPHVPSIDKVIGSFKKLSSLVGVNNIAWRYDPIFISEVYTIEKHIDSFENMASKMAESTQTCIISFIDLNEKTKKNFIGARNVKKAERLKIGEEFVRIGKKYGIQIKTCAEGKELEKFGVDCRGCMTQEVIEKAINHKLYIPKKIKTVRNGCKCILGNDIGMYNTCGHGCVYCYANFDQKVVQQNRKQHNPNSPLLIGGSMPEDVIIEVRQDSYIDGQLSFLLD